MNAKYTYFMLWNMFWYSDKSIVAIQIEFCVLLGGARTDHVMAKREEYI